MDHLPQKKKKLKIFPILGIITLVLGVFITLQATQQNNDTRNRAQVMPNSYPVPWPTRVPGVEPPTLWSTRMARLAADTFYIRIGNKYFYGNSNVQVHSNPGVTYQTLEMIWQENGVEMRMFLYFRQKYANRWEMFEMRTYNGNPQGDWIYYDLSKSPVEANYGEAYTSLERRFFPNNGIDAEVFCKNCLIEPFMLFRGKGDLNQLKYYIEPSISLPRGEILQYPSFTNPIDLGMYEYDVAIYVKDWATGQLVNSRHDLDIQWSSDSYEVLDLNFDNDVVESNILSRVNMRPKKFGYALITVNIISRSTGQLLGTTSFSVRVGESTNRLNSALPTCTIAVYSDNPNNAPPQYILQSRVSTVQPGQTVVVATNFYNKTNKQYEKARFNVGLGKYFQFIDSNGKQCSYNKAGESMVCDHGMFLNNGATSMAFRVKYLGAQAAPATIFGTTFTSNGDTGSCSTTVNAIPVVAQ